MKEDLNEYSNNQIGEEINQEEQFGGEKQLSDSEKKLKESKRLRNFGVVILAIGIISSIVMLFSTAMTEKKGWSGNYDEFNPMCIIYAISAFLPSYFIWALLCVVSNISDSLTKIASKK